MTHDIAGPGTGPKTGTSGAYGPSWDGDGDGSCAVEDCTRSGNGYMCDEHWQEHNAMLRAVTRPKPNTATHTYRITYTGPAHPQAAIEAFLRTAPAKHFRWEAVEDA